MAAIAPSPTGTAFCIASPRRRNRRAASSRVERTGRAKRRILAERVPGDIGRLPSRSKPVSVSRTRSAAMLVAISAGCAFAVRVRSVLRALEHQAGKFLGQGCVDAVEDLARNAKLVRQRFSHADRLGALTRKHQGRLHGSGFPTGRRKGNSARSRRRMHRHGPRRAVKHADLPRRASHQALPTPNPYRNGSAGSSTSLLSAHMKARPLMRGKTPPVGPGSKLARKRLPMMLSCTQTSPGCNFPSACEAGKLRAGAGSARRPVVGAAGAEHEVAAVGLGRSGGAEELDVVDLCAVLAA